MMTGSNAVLSVVPIVMLAALGLWLGLVYWVGAHPEWKAHRLAREAGARELAPAVTADQVGQPSPRAGLDQAAAGQAQQRAGGGETRLGPRAA